MTFPEIPLSDFLKVDIRVGQILEVIENEKSKQPAYIMTLDFGKLGKKISSAQITENYSKEELVGKQIFAIVNFAPKRVAGIKSEVLVLAAVCKAHGIILLELSLPLENGTRIA